MPRPDLQNMHVCDIYSYMQLKQTVTVTGRQKHIASL